MAEVIEGKVAKILDEYSLIINVGQADGVTPESKFVVYAQGDEVTDPDTGESLGRWEVVKGHIAASHVQERLTVCKAVGKKPEAPQSDPTTHTLSAAMIADHMRTDRAGSALNVNRSQIDGAPKVGPISVGDSVRSVGV